VGAGILTRERVTTSADPDRHDVERAAAGDAAAFERIYRRHVPRVHGMCRRMLSGAGEETDDVTQEVFIRAWEKLALFRGDAAFGTWLYRLAVNVILARRQSRTTYHDRFGGGDPDVIPLATRRDRTDLRLDVEAAIGTLPAGAREVFLLHDVEGFTHEEIAGMLNVSEGTSKSQLHRARMSLRRYLQ
jgi:RNA polymerase sigma-70 factor (ECF subfamily)